MLNLLCSLLLICGKSLLKLWLGTPLESDTIPHQGLWQMIRGEIERSDYNLRQPAWQHCQQNKIYEGWSTALISTNSKAFLVSARKSLDLFKSWLNQLNWKAAFSKLRVDNLSSFFFTQVMRCPFSKPILPVRVWCSRKIKLLWTCGGIHYAVFWLLGGKWKQEQFFTCF